MIGTLTCGHSRVLDEGTKVGTFVTCPLCAGKPQVVSIYSAQPAVRRTVKEVRDDLHNLFMKYSGEGYPYNPEEINKLLDELREAIMREYYTS